MPAQRRKLVLPTDGWEQTTIESVSQELRNTLGPKYIDIRDDSIVLDYPNKVISRCNHFETILRHHFEGDLVFFEASPASAEARSQSDATRVGTLLVRYHKDDENAVHSLDKVTLKDHGTENPSFYSESKNLGGRYEDGVKLINREFVTMGSVGVSMWTAAEHRVERVARETPSYRSVDPLPSDAPETEESLGNHSDADLGEGLDDLEPSAQSTDAPLRPFFGDQSDDDMFPDTTQAESREEGLSNE